MLTELTDANYASTLEQTTLGLVLCKKKLCPHCKNMEKVVEKFSATVSGVSYFFVDSEASAQALAGMGAERVPTLSVIKNGKIAATKTGLMNPRELAAFFQQA